MSRRHETRRGPSRPLPNKNTAAVETRIPSNQPTTLTLFRFTPEELSQAGIRKQMALTFRQDLTEIRGTFEEFAKQTGQRQVDVMGAIKSFMPVIEACQSRIATTSLFIPIDVALENLGVNPQERFDFFSQILAINCAADANFCRYALTQKKRLERTPLEYPKVFEGPNAKQRGIDRIFSRLTAIIPPWYKGDKKAWRAFVAKQAIFEPDSLIENAGAIRKNALPDWYTQRDSETPPHRDTILAERKDTLSQWKTIAITRNNAAIYHDDGLEDNRHTRFNFVAASIEQQLRDAFPNFQSLADVLQFLHMVVDVHGHTVTPEEMLPMTNKELESHELTPTQLREKTIQEFAVLQETAPSIDMLALFLERKLLEGGIIQNAKELVTDNHIGSFGLLVDTMDDSMPLAEQFFLILKGTYPEIFTALNDHIRPLLELLPTEERTELKELISASKDTPIEEIIWLIAGTITKHATGNKQTLSPLRTFTEEWLTAFWGNKDIQEQLAHALGEETEVPDKEETPIQVQIKALGEAIVGLQKGNLGGWHIYHAQEPTTNKRAIKELGGQTLEERQETLTALFQERGITKDTRLFTDFLDWAILLPQEVDEKPKRGKDRFKKVRLGEVSYQVLIDPLKQEIVFTL